HADDAVGGLGFGEAVLDVGAQGVQRQASLEIPLRARDLVAVQAARDAHLDAFAAEAQGRIHRLTHGAAEADALLELQRDVLRHELGIELRLVHFLDVDEDLTRGPLLQFELELVDLGAFAADDDARARRLDDDAQLVARTLDLDGADAGGLELLAQLRLELHVLEQQLAVI